ncbi:MAG: hypothetical protein ABSB53_04730 [Nitrososphaerales archaeon]
MLIPSFRAISSIVVCLNPFSLNRTRAASMILEVAMLLYSGRTLGMLAPHGVEGYLS